MKAAVGTRLPVSTPGPITTEKVTLRPAAGVTLAVRAAAVPMATAPFESPRMPLTLPEPVLAALPREVTLAGSVQTVESVEDFSLQ